LIVRLKLRNILFQFFAFDSDNFFCRSYENFRIRIALLILLVKFPNPTLIFISQLRDTFFRFL